MSAFTIFNRNALKIAFPATFALLLVCIIYIMSIEPLPTTPNICEFLKDTDGTKNISREWWQWACLIDRDWNAEPEYDCQDIRHMGNYRICYDKLYRPEPPCLVYSFGIDNDFDFDDDMAKAGCHVYSFDPSMGVEDHQRSERVRFFNIGLSTQDSDTFLPLLDSYTQGKDKTWRIRTLASLKKMIGHENKTLDVLKIDIETYEWPILKQLLQDGSLKYVRQFTLEWHIFPNEPMRTEFSSMYKTYMGLKAMGFRTFAMKPGYRRHHRLYFSMQADAAYVNALHERTISP